jgi:FMN reductase
MDMKVLIIATSLNPGSRSQRMARIFASKLKERGIDHELVDMRELPLPSAGSNEGWSSPDVPELTRKIEGSSHIVIASPVYNFYLNSVAKNVMELCGRAMSQKVIGFICSAGGKGSYMSVMNFANSLMLDFRCVIAPRFVYTDKEGWADEDTLTPELDERVGRLINDLQAIQVTPVE